MPQIIKTSCSAYVFNKTLNLNKICQCIDEILLDQFNGKSVVIRGIQSGKHELSKEQLLKQIIETGSDQYAAASANGVKVSEKPIDLFGYYCIVKNPPIVLPVLEGFHKWKPKSLERPQRQVDIWIIYDANQLKNVEYTHSHYGVKARDGYVFKAPNDKTAALLAVIVIE